jgi:hypothetical protein
MFDQHMHHMQRKARGSVLKAEDNPNILDELTTIGVKSLDKMKAPCCSIHGHFKGCDLDSMSIISDLTDVPASEFANLSAVDIGHYSSRCGHCATNIRPEQSRHASLIHAQRFLDTATSHEVFGQDSEQRLDPATAQIDPVVAL